MHNFSFSSGVLFCAALSFYPAFADETTSDKLPVTFELDEYVVTGGPVARSVGDFVSPYNTLDQAAIQRENGSTLGALLESQTGVHASSFGGGASRPIIRGFDGPRVRILDSGIEQIDVSETSPDHAVSVEPLLVDRVEIIRGPSTLLYGSSAIGGVVNVIGKEIPRQRVDAKGYSGAFETRYDTASDGMTYLGYGTVGGENWALRVTGLSRDADDYDIPGEAEAEHDEEEHHDGDDHDAEHDEAHGVLENSYVETDSLSLGGTWFFNDRNYIGAAVSQYESFYGVPGHAHAHEEEDGAHGDDEEEEESVAIDLERTRFDLEIALFDPLNWIEAARFRFGYTDYEHTELEGAETGTIFERDGYEFRAEAAHYEWFGADEGVFGVQISDTDFSAIGDEAFTPPSETSDYALFVSEHIHKDSWHFEYGARIEYRKIDAQTVNGNYSDVALSVAGGLIYNLNENNSIALSLQRSERHPTSTELFADGPHLATSQFEIGDPTLELETAYGIDLSYRHRSADWKSTLTTFVTYFEDYVFADETGAEMDELPVFQFAAVDALFWGFEAEIDRVFYQTEKQQFTLGLVGDFVRAENLDDDENLPRIPPLRIGLQGNYENGPWQTGVLLRRAFKQTLDATGESETDGYTELKADLGYEFTLNNGTSFTAFIQANNLLDEDIRHHTSFLKDVAPLPGRSFTIGGRFEF